MKPFHWVLGFALAVPLAPAEAAELQILRPEKSFVRFVIRQMNVPVEGHFRSFRANVSFDPAHPELGKADIAVDLASIDTGSDEADAEVKGKGWFNVATFPVARFVSTGLRRVGPNRLEATGTLTIKGRSRPVAVLVNYSPAGADAVLEGAFPLRRLQFGIGEGEWSDTDTVADEVEVRFRFTVGAGRPRSG